jgi:hypothetical protein
LFYFPKYNRENVGIKTEDGKITFMSLKRFEAQSKIEKSEQHILIGSYIYPEYYNKGESLVDGSGIVQNDNVLKWINLRYSDKIENMHQKFENIVGYYDGENYYTASDYSPQAYGYKSWREMAFYEVFGGDIDVWNHYNQ